MDVLRQTLGLVDQSYAPALVDYPDTFIDDTPAEDGWSCPVTLPSAEPKTESDSLKAQLGTEAQLLRPWFDEGLRTRGRTTMGISGKGADSISEMLGILATFSVDANIVAPDGYAQPMPQLLRYLTADIRAFYSEAAISKPGGTFPNPEELEEWFFLETVAGGVFYQVRERLLSADLHVLMAQGLDDNEIDSRLVLRPGTTARMADEVVRRPGINRVLLQVSVEDFKENLIGRSMRSIVPTAMRDRHSDRINSERAS
ncbi:MAG: hypothetical protein OSB75_13725 [Dehalococcoidia bacterium]|nr:hypothetical protein [Dehalococcoidia bacterium]